MKRLWVVSYDIADDRRLRRVAQLLEAVGSRVEFSVFECSLDLQDVASLRERLSLEIDAEADSVRYYPVCEWCERRVTWLGQGKAPEDPAYFTV
jgi:CRISPR-associated protein Cas2